jgi:microcystin-dependent protein
MMQQTIPVNDGYISSHVGATPSTGPFAVDFPFFSLNDVTVTRTADASFIPELLVRGVDYDITGVATDDGSFSSGSVTLHLAVSNTTVVRFRSTPIERLSNFPLQGFFSRLVLNAELNKITVWMQELNGLLGTTTEASQAHAPLVSPLFVGDPRAPTPAFGDSDTSLATTAFVQAALAGIGAAVPTATVVDFAGATAPAGWLMCYGQAVNRTTYAGLFTAIGTAYNTGGEAGTDFRLPDLRGRTIAGLDATGANRLTALGSGIDGSVLGASGGTETHTLTIAQMAAHAHSGADHYHQMANHAHTMPASPVYINAGNMIGYASGTPAGGFLGWSSGPGGMDAVYFTGYSQQALTTGTIGSSTSHLNTQPTIVLNKIIKT